MIMFFNMVHGEIQDWREDFESNFFNKNFNTAQDKLEQLNGRINREIDRLDPDSSDGEVLFLRIWKIRTLYASGRIDEAIQEKERLFLDREKLNIKCDLTQRGMRKKCNNDSCSHQNNINLIEGLDFLSDKSLKENYVDLWVVVNSDEVNYRDAGKTPEHSKDATYISKITEKTDVFWENYRVRFSLNPPRFESNKYFANQVDALERQKEYMPEFIEYINLLSKLHRIESLRDKFWDHDNLKINFSYTEKKSDEKKNHYLRFADSIPSQLNAGKFGLKIPHIPKLEDLFRNFREGSEYYQFYTQDEPNNPKLKRYSFKTNKEEEREQFLFLSWRDGWKLVEQTEPDQIVFEIPDVFIKDKKIKFYLSNLGEDISEPDLIKRMSNIDKQIEIEEIDFAKALNDRDYAKILKAKGITIEKPDLDDRKQITQWKIDNCSDNDRVKNKEIFCKEYRDLYNGDGDLGVDVYILKIDISEYKQFSTYDGKDEKIDLIIYEEEDKKAFLENPLNRALLTFVLGLLLGI